MNITRYKDIEDFLFSQLPMFQRVGPKAFKKDLKNMEQLDVLMGHPHREFKSIHVAGTNGKGSTSFFIACLLEQAGYKVGLYTSPHYKSYRERIKVNGNKISKSFVKRFVNDLINKKVFEQALKPSFFEISVAMAFSYFRKEDVDYAVIETGLGGRLDSTNVIMPVLSVITNIGYDHMNFLGTTLPEIAAEKAGIIKPGIPVVIGREQEETRIVFEKKANEMKASLSHSDNTHLTKEIKALFPSYQNENIKLALSALSLLNVESKLKDQKTAFTIGLQRWGYMGRFQKLSANPMIIADSAHNEMGISTLFRELAKLDFSKLHIVLAVVADKDLDLVFPYFPVDAKYYFSAAKIPRAMKSSELHSKASAAGLRGKIYKTVGSALGAAKLSASPKDLILVTGSIFTVAEII